ncbi:OpgC domain-containing protein [Aeromicrobium sp. IC_218]|uniref:OpgC domain-containing protein n=1 Tax=Aeromicrobium sp. IC_218 TaxID=2545468 RepID=UPI00103C385C|nr:OpgC domain-containing protein [Aeromicrobium sp. IC_218]TCJ00545.1 acyltransferase domain-containing protein [Aeromicrobium sp. IC_218]
MSGRPPTTVHVLLAALVGLLLTLVGAPAQAVPDGPDADRAWFGPNLDWEKQTATGYAEHLGASPSLYAQRVHYPLAADDVTYLDQFVQQATSQGAVAVVELQPQVPLDQLTEADAERLADRLAGLERERDAEVLVRFAPEMNASWVTWGQSPTDYRRAFRVVADAVHADAPNAAMVWSPAYGAGYPYGTAYGALESVDPERSAALDTDDDGDVTEADDPYGPYYPGDEAVDWVGLSLYHFGEVQDFGENVRPDDGDFAARLDEQAGYGDERRRRSFYDRFAEGRDKPMLVETGALYNVEARGGDGELDVKRTWWRQVLAELPSHPQVDGVTWLELRRQEAEADGDVVDWRAVHRDDLADDLRADLEDSSVDLGPVTRVLDQESGNEASQQGWQPDDVSAEMGWIVLCVVLLAVAYLFSGFAGRYLRSWRYPDEDDPRDRRLDLFRGWIILAVVITHIEVSGPYSYVTLNAIGAITGAEMFVLLSGVVLGMIYAPTVKRFGEWATAVMMLRRARKQYLVALAVVMIVYLLSLLPFVDASVITTFTDRGTGSEGEGAQGLVYDLYANAPRLFDYPPPWYAVKQLLLLQIGPWVFNIMGLFVVLSLLLPVIMWFVRRGMWWLVLAVSWGLYLLDAAYSVRVLPSQFQDVFPLLTWQLPFMHGLVLGHYRRHVQRALTTRLGKVLVGVVVVGYAAALGYLWLCHRVEVRPDLLPANAYGYLYDHAYIRVFLQWGRLLDLAVMLVVAYAFLTTCWKPVNAVIGWLWIPLGQASLYVFIVHVFFVLAVGNIPGLDRMSIWQGVLVHTVVILTLWVMVKKKFLFSVIPR